MAFNNLAVSIGGEETVNNIRESEFSTNRSILQISSAIMTFFLAATLYPEIVRLAQKELDEVLGVERLPEISDKPQLPYISAIVKEVLRWKPPNPLGILL